MPSVRPFRATARSTTTSRSLRVLAPALGLALAASACDSTQPAPLQPGEDAGVRADTGVTGPRPDASRPGEDAAATPGADATTGQPDASTSPDAAVRTETFTLTFGPVAVPPGTERTQCVVKRLGNAGLVHIGSIHNVLAASSHHLIVYRVRETEEQTAPFNCQPFTDTLDPTRGSPLMITQRHDELLALPDGVAYSLEPNQMIRLEMHYINATTREANASATSSFTTIADDQFRDEADFLFIGNPDIRLPPMMTTTLGPTYFRLPADYDGVNFFAITGHEHQYGTKVTVATTPSRAGADTMVYDVPNWLWSEPATVYQNPPFVVPPGGGFRFTCRWNNTSSREVLFGESANNEMCFFWAYYYPSHGARVCFHTDRIPGGIDLCCPGHPACSAILH